MSFLLYDKIFWTDETERFFSFWCSVVVYLQQPLKSNTQQQNEVVYASLRSVQNKRPPDVLHPFKNTLASVKNLESSDLKLSQAF